MYEIFGSSMALGFLSSSALALSKLRWMGSGYTMGFLWAMLFISASFSFKIPIASIGGERVFIKFDDFILAALILCSLFKIKEWKSTPLDLPVILFILACIISIFLGIISGIVSQPLLNVLYLFKLIQYFMLFFLMVNTLSAASKARLYLFIALSASVLVSIYGIIEHFFPYVHYPYGSQFFYRIYERGFFYHDSNHFAAYLMFSASIFFGLFLYSQKNNLLRLCFFGAILVLLPALFWTYSRSAYVALFISALIISGFKSRKILVFTIIFLIFFVFILAPSSILERINSFKSTILNSDPHGSSIAYRIQQINYAFETFWQHPLFGIGLGSRERVFYENQFMMFLSETGLLGLSLFLGILAGVFFVAISLYKATKDMFIRGLCAGFIGGFTGLLLESNTIIVFVASRIMIPFWIITGILFWFYLRERLVQADGLKKA